MSIQIVLYCPLIPQNTGSIARLTAANNLKLHLIEPLGFELSDKYLKRAGLDYWKYVDFEIHNSWETFITKKEVKKENISLLSTKATNTIFQAKFNQDSILVFGNESHGLPENIHEMYLENRFKIPMPQPGVRSLNLATSVGIVTYEALRQTIYAI
jgi:tRNA (cytidine/uridine-2'-O-)-methyltransferase